MKKNTNEFKAMSKTQQAREYIEDLITSGVLQPGDRIITEDQLVKKLGVSLITVRRALAELTEEGMIYRVQGRGTFVSENLNDNHPSSKLVSLVYIHAANVTANSSFLSPVIDGMTEIAMKSELNIKLNPIPKEMTLAESLIAAGNIQDYSGGIISVNYILTREDYDLLKKHNIPCVQIGEASDKVIPFVHVDHYKGGGIAAEQMIQRGKKKIALIMGDLKNQHYCNDIIKGAVDTFKDNGLTIDDKLVAESFTGTEDEGYKLAAKTLAMQSDVEGIIGYGEELNLGILQCLHDFGKKIPEDCSVISYNNFPKIANYRNPSITAISQPVRELGVQAMKTLMALKDKSKPQPSSTLMEPILIKRES